MFKVDTDDLLKPYKEVFSEGLGALKGFIAKFYIMAIPSHSLVQLAHADFDLTPPISNRLRVATTDRPRLVTSPAESCQSSC